MKKCKKITAVFLAVIMLLSVMPIAGIDFFKASAATLPSSGQITNTMSYTFDSSTGTLTISGTGNMSDYSRTKSPFYNNSSIKTVIIEDGITSIGKNAFYYCEKLISITIPDSVTSIGDCAFEDCNHLISITIPTSVTSIGEWAFGNCNSLVYVYFGGTVKQWITIEIAESNFALFDADIYCTDGQFGVRKNGDVCYILNEGTRTLTISGTGDMAYHGTYLSSYDYSSINNYIIEYGITSIGNGAFKNCASLESITIPASVTSIGDYAFEDCYHLISITIPTSVTSIGKWAFFNCSSLKSITIPASVTSIGDCAFYFCDSLTDVYFNGTIEQWNAIDIEAGNEELLKANIHCKDGMLCVRINKDRSINYIFNEKTGTLTISGTGNIDMNNMYFHSPDVVSIWQLFADYSIKDVIIENGITTIGEWAFPYNCDSLKSITIPASVTSIGDCAFYFYYSLTDVYYNGTIEQWNAIDIEAGNEELLKANIHCKDGMLFVRMNQDRSINYIFNEKTGTLTISGTGNIDMNNVLYFHSPDVVSIWQLFADYSIKDVIIENGITSIGDWAFSFYNCDRLKSITIPDSVTSIGNGAFGGCSGLTNITIPASVTSIGDWAFAECYNLKSIEIPDSVTSIGEGAFNDCYSLESITIPDSVTSIGDSVFYNCYGLTSVTIPDSVTSIGRSAFYNCYQLTDVYYGGTEEEWNAIEIESYNDYLLNANIHFIVPDDGRVYLNDTVYYIYDEASGELTISGTGDMPDYSFDDSPFQQLGSIKKVTVKGNVTRIGDYAFYQNENITDVTISSELKSIGYEAFLGCTVLENITFPESLTEIGEFAFKGCSSIEDVIIPDSVTGIGMGAFANCQGIKSINVGAGNSVYDSRNNCNAIIETATNTLVLGCVNTAIPDNITSIGMASFMYCNITNVVIPEGVTSICDEAFACCENLESVSIPSTVTSIGHIVFYTCPKLSDIYYNGTKYQWKAIEIGEFNINLQNATIHFITVETDPITEDCGLSFDSTDGDIITLSGFTPGATVSDLQKMISDGWTVSVKTVDGSDRIGTGSVITLTSAEGDEIECIAVVYGDTTGDSWYDGTDSLIVNCISNGLLSEAQVGEAVYAAADCNHDDVIDENDVAILEQAGLILANVDQSKTPAELFEDAAFCEYINLIDQSPVTAEKSVEEAPTDTTPTVTKTLLQKIMDFIIYIFKIITSNIPKVF